MECPLAPSQIEILDPSDRFRPERRETIFRNFTQDNIFHLRVKNTYDMMHTNQTHEVAKEKLKKWTSFNHAEMTVMEALELINQLVDESDPDVDVPNSVHAYQTAERIRAAHPDKPWFQFTGLIHDLGKMLAVWGEPQWCVVGDTFATGCAFSDQCVFGKASFENNIDFDNPKYNSRLGIYKENCGLENIVMSWGHDEYMYHVLKNNRCYLPDEAYYMIRFHSFYPWHTGGDYDFLCSDKDRKMLDWVLEFNKFDLYSKADDLPDIDAIRPYYEQLAGQFLPGKLKW